MRRAANEVQSAKFKSIRLFLIHICDLSFSQTDFSWGGEMRKCEATHTHTQRRWVLNVDTQIQEAHWHFGQNEWQWHVRTYRKAQYDRRRPINLQSTPAKPLRI